MKEETIVKYLNENKHMNLVKQERLYTGRCCFCKNKYSFAYDPKNQIFQCFHCDIGGGISSLLDGLEDDEPIEVEKEKIIRPNYWDEYPDDEIDEEEIQWREMEKQDDYEDLFCEMQCAYFDYVYSMLNDEYERNLEKEKIYEEKDYKEYLYRSEESLKTKKH